MLAYLNRVQTSSRFAGMYTFCIHSAQNNTKEYNLVEYKEY